jgi:hypothetical protein
MTSAVHGKVPRRPDGLQADIAGEDRFVASEFVRRARDLLRMQRAAGLSTTSLGITMMLTQRSKIARRTAILSARGICPGVDTRSQ